MRRGLIEGFLAYLLWGVLPIFWKQLGDVDSVDVVANRVMWTFLLLVGLQLVRSTWRGLLGVSRDPRVMLTMLGTSVLITLNWLVYIWAVDQNRVVEASLGYFINPLVAVFLGVVVLGERLPRIQWIAIAIAGAGVAWLTFDVGRLPWISLTLAFSFGLYGLLRKTARVESFNGLTIEMGWLFPIALGFVVIRGIGGEPAAVADQAAIAPLLVLTGVVTAAPLLLFASAARRIPLATVGLLQYVAPTLQLIIGVWVYDEAFDGGQLVGFGLIWIALLVFSSDVVRRHFGRRALTPVLQPAG